MKLPGVLSSLLLCGVAGIAIGKGGEVGQEASGSAEVVRESY
jgi:hypothetical protein